MISVLISEAVIIPILAVLLGIQEVSLLLLTVIFLGTLGFVGIGTFISAMTVNTRAREELLPIILFPLLVPVLIASARATVIILSGSDDGLLTWLQHLVVYNATCIGLSALLFGYVLEE